MTPFYRWPCIIMSHPFFLFVVYSLHDPLSTIITYHIYILQIISRPILLFYSLNQNIHMSNLIYESTKTPWDNGNSHKDKFNMSWPKFTFHRATNKNKKSNIPWSNHNITQEVRIQLYIYDALTFLISLYQLSLIILFLSTQTRISIWNQPILFILLNVPKVLLDVNFTFFS